jgi:hypothetical protein
MRDETHVAAIGEGIESVKTGGPGSLGVTALFNDEVLPRYNVETGHLDQIKKSRLTARIEAKDRARDRSWRGFKLFLEAMTHSLVDTVREAAETLLDIANHYGDIARRKYDDESAAASDAIREFRLAANKALLALVGGTTLLDELETANNEFMELVHTRFEETAQRPTARMKDLRAATDEAWNALLDRVAAQVILYGLTSASSNYAPFVAEWNAIVDHYDNLLALDRGRRSAKKEGEEGEEEL